MLRGGGREEVGIGAGRGGSWGGNLGEEAGPHGRGGVGAGPGAEGGAFVSLYEKVSVMRPSGQCTSPHVALVVI